VWGRIIKRVHDHKSARQLSGSKVLSTIGLITSQWKCWKSSRFSRRNQRLCSLPENKGSCGKIIIHSQTKYQNSQTGETWMENISNLSSTNSATYFWLMYFDFGIFFLKSFQKTFSAVWELILINLLAYIFKFQGLQRFIELVICLCQWYD
jgi:hypothetical protein